LFFDNDDDVGMIVGRWTSLFIIFSVDDNSLIEEVIFDFDLTIDSFISPCNVKESKYIQFHSSTINIVIYYFFL
jgi:hypothetical protein